MKYIKIKFWKFIIYLIKKGYDTDCPDYEEECISCQARKVINFLNKHIELIKWYN